MTKLVLSCKVHPELHDRVLDLAARMKIHKSAIVQLALESYLASDPQPVDSVNQVDLLVRIEELEKRVTTLESKSTAVNPVDSASIQAPKKVEQLQSGANVTCPSCGSDGSKLWGRGKLRTDGTRSQRFRCAKCDRIFSVG